MLNTPKKETAVRESAPETPAHAVCGSDPIFAAIAERHAVMEELIAATHVHDAFWETLPPEAKRRPYVMAGGSAAFDHAQIDELVDANIDQLREKWGDFLDVAQMEELRADRHAKFDAEQQAVARIQHELGYTAVKARFDAVQMADIEALRAVCRTVPTTLLGVSALAGWVNEKFEELANLDKGEPLAELLANLKHTVRTFAFRASRISEIQSAS